MAEETEDIFEGADKSREEFTDKFKESIDFLRDAIVSLGDRLTNTLKDSIENTNKLDDATKRVANRYRRELETSIDKVIIGTDTLQELQNKINKGLDITVDVNKEIAKLEIEREKIISKANTYKRYGIDLEQETNLQLKIHLEEQANILKNLKEENKNRENSLGLLGKLAEGSSHLIDHLDKSGKWNKALGLDEAIKKTREFATEQTKAGKQIGGYKQNMAITTNLISNIGKNLLKVLGPLFIVHQLIEAFVEIDKSTGNTAKNLGTSYNEALALKGEMAKAAFISDDIFVNSENLLESFVKINNALGTRASLNKDDLKTFTLLTERAKISEGSAITIQKLGLLTGTTLKKQTTEIFGQINLNKTKSNLALNEKQLLESISKVSSSITFALKGSGAAIADAVFQAKALGVELDTVEKIQSSLLDFETSINNEIQAELLLNKDLNLEKARYYALTNDAGNLALEIQREINSLSEQDLANLQGNIIKQKAYADAFGVSKDEMASMIMESQILRKLEDKSITNLQDYYRELEEKHGAEKARAIFIEKTGNDTLAAQYDSISLQEKFNASVNKLKDIFVTIVEGPLAVLISGLNTTLDYMNKIGSVALSIVPEGLKDKLPTILASIAGIIGGIKLFGGLFKASKGTFGNPMITKDIGGGMGGGGDVGGNLNRRGKRSGLKGLFKGGFKEGLKSLPKAVGGMLPSLSTIGKVAKKGLKTNAITGTILGGIDMISSLKEGKSIGESLGRTIITGLTSVAGGALGSLVAPGVGTVAGGIGGGMLGDQIGDWIFKNDEAKQQGEEVNDVLIPNDDRNVIKGPKGTFKLNKDDDIVAGTNLFDSEKTKDKIITNNNNELLLVELKKMTMLLNILINQKQNVYLDGYKVGEALTSGKANINM
jgi:hypothetical protein